jgi:hypothetical protein
MKVQYRNTFRDIIVFSLRHNSRSPVVIGSLVFFLVVFAFVLKAALPPELSSVEKVFVFLVSELIAAAFLAALMAVNIVLSMISKRNRTVLTDHTIILGDDSFVEQTEFNRNEQTWTGVQKLARTSNYIFIYIAQHMAHVIPRRAFTSDAEWDAFFAFCEQRVARAKR